MRIIETVPRLEQEASGPSYSVPWLAASLTALGHDVRLMSVGGLAAGLNVPTKQSRFTQDFARVPLARSLVLSSAFYRALRGECETADIIHAHGLWLMPNVYPAWAAVSMRKPFVVSPRGTLSRVALARSAWRKKAFWALLQAKALRQAQCLHATSEQEYLDIRGAGLMQPVAVIPNGVELPDRTPSKKRTPRLRRLLYLGRLHPIKGLESLLIAWSRASLQFPDWELRLVGPDSDGHLDTLRALTSRLDLRRVSFAGPQYGADKSREYGLADLFVLPSHSENFGMSVAEALAQGVPVITTTGTPWSGVRTEGCGWWVASDVGALGQALDSALATEPAELARMGERGRRWVASAFSWSGVARQMEAVYGWVLNGGPAPETVRER